MRRIGAIVVGSLMVLAACEPTFGQSSRVEDEGTHSATTNFDDPYYGRYASYGVETTNSIRVLVVGNCVKSPGYYFVSKGSTCRDAIKLAGVEKGYEDWAGLVINIGRKGQTKGRYRMLHFGAPKKAEQEVLRDGDEVEIRNGRINEKHID
jgi:hypothetical protein